MKIYNIVSSKSVYVPKNLVKKEHTEDLGIANDISKKAEINSDRVLFESNDNQAFRTIYNNATLKNKTSEINNLNIKMTDDEINNEVNRKLYERNHLDKEGIEFNSKEFKEWLSKMKHNFPIPPDAPAKVRKEVYDMLDSVKDPGIKFLIVRDFARGFKKVKEPSDLNACMKVTNEVLKKNKDSIELLRLLNSNDTRIKNSIDHFNEVVNVVSSFRTRLKNFIRNY